MKRVQFSRFCKVTQGFICPEYEVLLWFGCKGGPDAHVLKFRSQDDGLSTSRGLDADDANVYPWVESLLSS